VLELYLTVGLRLSPPPPPSPPCTPGGTGAGAAAPQAAAAAGAAAPGHVAVHVASATVVARAGWAIGDSQDEPSFAGARGALERRGEPLHVPSSFHDKSCEHHGVIDWIVKSRVTMSQCFRAG